MTDLTTDSSAGAPAPPPKPKKPHGDFVKLLQVVNRNQYTRNQMVDRKARILLSVNAVLLSLIIGRVITRNVLPDATLALLAFLGLACFVSMVFAVLAVLPERTHVLSDALGAGREPHTPLARHAEVSGEDYVAHVLAIQYDGPAIHEAIIRDTYHLSTALRGKRRLLQSSLWIFIVGLCLSVAIAVVARALAG